MFLPPLLLPLLATQKPLYLSFNIRKSKEMIVDDRRQQGSGYLPIHIGDFEVGRVNSFRILKFLGVYITENLSWSLHMDSVVKKAHQQLYFLKKFGMNAIILTNFYRCTIKSLLTDCVTVWYDWNCSVHSCKSIM